MTKPVTFLNIGAGRSLPLDFRPEHDFCVNVDKNYAYELIDVSDILAVHSEGIRGFSPPPGQSIYYLKQDVIEFLSTYYYKFKSVAAYRFMEHIPRSELLYVIHLISDILETDGTFDIIVPNYEILAQRILEESQYSLAPTLETGKPDFSLHQDFEKYDIEVTSELLNEPHDPHLSIWTPARAIRYLTLENQFKIETLATPYQYDNRIVYIYIRAIKI